MAAAAYFNSAKESRSAEEILESQAEEIEEEVLLFQTRLRGFLSRQSIVRHGERSVFLKARRSRRTNDVFSDGTEIQTERIYAYDHRRAKRLVDPESLGLNALNHTAIGNLDRNTQETPKEFLVRKSFDEGQSGYVKAAITIPPESVLEAVSHWHTEVAPWWIQEPLGSEEGELCNICMHINFDALLHTTDAQEISIPLGLLGAIANKTECSFCRLVAHTGSFTLDVSIENLKSHSAKIYCELGGDIKWNQYATRIRTLCVTFNIIVPNERYSPRIYGWIQQILPDGKYPPEQSRNDSRLIKDQIDFNLVSRWLATCKEQHHSTSLESMISSGSMAISKPTEVHHRYTFNVDPCHPILANNVKFDLTLVDVKRECLVDLPISASYVALSYVWGGPQSFQNTISTQKSLYVPHNISVDDNAIPLTIRDAIQVVRNLGERYLWVDSLCICQDKTENKMKQIMNMGDIYGGALLTIIALSGSNANAGLPGVRTLSRNNMQQIEFVQGMTLVNELPPLMDIIQQSLWNTRCWTYQEKQFSKRCLIFCKTHVFFQCNQAIFKEDSGTRNVQVKGARAIKIRAEKLPIWYSYKTAVVEYTKRRLSDESDALNAFQGIINLLQPAFKGDFLFGLPETELDVALLWQPASQISRRVDPMTKEPLFPSWSWAGWVGNIEYLWTRHQIDDVSCIEWQCTDLVDGSTNFYTSDDLRAPKDNNYDSWEYESNSKGAPYYYRQNEPDIWCLHPVASKEKRRPIELLQPRSHHLTFKAYTTMFRISSTTWDLLEDPFRSVLDNAHHLHSLAIFGPDGFIAGRVLIPSHLLDDSLKSSYQEFICLSRRRHNQHDLAPHPPWDNEFAQHAPPPKVCLYPYNNPQEAAGTVFDLRRYNRRKPWPLYNVMMVRPKGDGVMERVALGVVHVTAFAQAGPVRKVVTLA